MSPKQKAEKPIDKKETKNEKAVKFLKKQPFLRPELFDTKNFKSVGSVSNRY